jgi:hypothetical protein
MANLKQTRKSDKAAAGSSNKTQQQIPVKTLAGSVLALLVIFGISLVIREIRFHSTMQEPVEQAGEHAESKEVSETPEVSQEPQVQIVEEQAPVEEVYVEPVPELPIQVQVEPEEQYDQQAYGWNNWQGWQSDSQRMEDAIQWMSWASTLTAEERMQLMQSSMTSMISLMQRWQSMSPEQVQEERAQWEEVIQQWRNLPSEDRQQGIQLIQQQLEEWLQSGQ